MKWISVLAGFAVALGLAMVFQGQNANTMKAESREGLILYGLLLCSISALWLVIHGITTLLGNALRTNDQK